jgi:hypothetical protein
MEGHPQTAAWQTPQLNLNGSAGHAAAMPTLTCR